MKQVLQHVNLLELMTEVADEGKGGDDSDRTFTAEN